MRVPFLLPTLVLGALATAAVPVDAAPTCTSTEDQSAYEVLALRQEMTLLGTKCGREQEYNKNFVVRFQPVLQANDREVLAYFRRLYGGAGQNRMQTFATDLVTQMSHEANQQGGEFCPRAVWVIREMDAVRSMDELASYAAVKVFSPVGMSMCPQGAAGSEERRRPRHR
ncbi:MAG TPA: hypothetical protein VGL72_04925 [Bryobacteraceae bacterium]